jgi:NAD(P)-dependent dehydrogenase (short-subunit alcohol dehydrogenase family)
MPARFESKVVVVTGGSSAIARAAAERVAAALFVAIEEWQARDGQGDLGTLIDRALGCVLAGPLRPTSTPKRR